MGLVSRASFSHIKLGNELIHHPNSAVWWVCLGYCLGTSWLDLRVLAWDVAAVVSFFGFLFWNFCVCALRAGICMEVPGQLLRVCSVE